MDASDWVTSAVAVLALGVAGWSLFYSKRSVAVSERAAVASERSAVAAERSADAAEALVPAPPPPVKWRIERDRGDGYLIRNTGSAPATNVRIEGLPAKSGLLHVRGSEPLTAGPGEAALVIVTGTLNTGRATSLRVECSELPEPVVLPVER